MLWNTMRLRIVRDRPVCRFWDRPVGRLWDRPVGRLSYGLAAVWYFYAWATFSADLHHAVLHTLNVVLAVAWTGLMICLVNGRMLDLRINRWWVLPYMLLLFGAAFLMAGDRSPAVAIAGYAAVTAPL